MAKKPNVIEIDLDEWCTMSDRAKQDGVKLNTVSSWVIRGLIEVREIPELKLRLVRKNTVKPTQ